MKQHGRWLCRYKLKDVCVCVIEDFHLKIFKPFWNHSFTIALQSVLPGGKMCFFSIYKVIKDILENQRIPVEVVFSQCSHELRRVFCEMHKSAFWESVEAFCVKQEGGPSQVEREEGSGRLVV